LANRKYLVLTHVLEKGRGGNDGKGEVAIAFCRFPEVKQGEVGKELKIINFTMGEPRWGTEVFGEDLGVREANSARISRKVGNWSMSGGYAGQNASSRTAAFYERLGGFGVDGCEILGGLSREGARPCNIGERGLRCAGVVGADFADRAGLRGRNGNTRKHNLLTVAMSGKVGGRPGYLPSGSGEFQIVGCKKKVRIAGRVYYPLGLVFLKWVKRAI